MQLERIMRVEGDESFWMTVEIALAYFTLCSNESTVETTYQSFYALV